MNFEEWYAKLSEWAEENTALNMSYAMQRHLARRLEEWESSRPTQRAADVWDVCHECGATETIDPNNDGVPICVECGTRR